MTKCNNIEYQELHSLNTDWYALVLAWTWYRICSAMDQCFVVVVVVVAFVVVLLRGQQVFTFSNSHT